MTTLLSIYLALNCAVAAGVSLLLLFEKLAPRVSARSLLQFHYGVASVLCLSVALQAALPAGLLSGMSLMPIDLANLAGGADVLSAADGSPEARGTFDAGSLARLWIATALVLLASGVAFITRDMIHLRSLMRGAHLVRSAGRVRVWVHDGAQTPFSWWRPGRAHVVLPSWLLQNSEATRVAIAHELQHHRQRDTVWLHAFTAIRLVCILNPLAHVWARAVRGIQEFACDEALIARGRCSPQAYAHCLIDIAERLRGVGRLPGVTSCLIGFGDPNSLRRRMKEMLEQSRSPWGRRRVQLCVATICGVMTLAGYVGAGTSAEDSVSSTKTVWPVDGVVLAGFGKHRGIDIAATAGASVRAYSAGTVITTQPIKGCAGRVQIKHGALVGTYCNLSDVGVSAGEVVGPSTVIGRIADAPPGVKPHLHFELSEETFIDPQSRLPRISAAN